ncbi:MAG: hypothetical protein IMF14_05280 [Proteobacteria bacterium]|nr:hypothetical protein [Pseudomonadota bacterium]
MPSAATHKIDDYESLLVALQDVLGIVVPERQRVRLLEELTPLLQQYKLDSIDSLAKSLTEGASGNSAEDIRSSVLELISQRHNSWQLRSEITDVLNNYVVAQLPQNARVWIVGCGQGQMAYSLAMELAEYEKKNGEIKGLQLFASDVPLSDIEYAQGAVYTESQTSDLSDDYKKSYLTQSVEAEGQLSWQIKDKVSQRVTFSECDLTNDFQLLENMDLIICPEVLVYFSNGVKSGILEQFSSLLNPGGIFLTCINQAILPFTQSFERVEHPAGVFYRQKG